MNHFNLTEQRVFSYIGVPKDKTEVESQIQNEGFAPNGKHIKIVRQSLGEHHNATDFTCNVFVDGDLKKTILYQKGDDIFIVVNRFLVGGHNAKTSCA